MNKIKKWWRIHMQDKITVLDILQYADKHRDKGLCWTFTDACIHYRVSQLDFDDKCKKFNLEEASKFNAILKHWWWKPDVWDTGREKFLHYLIDYYSKQEPIYLEKYDKRRNKG